MVASGQRTSAWVIANPARAPGEWQSYDAIRTAPVFAADGTPASPACVTVVMTGVLVQDHYAQAGTDQAAGPWRPDRLSRDLAARVEMKCPSARRPRAGRPRAGRHPDRPCEPAPEARRIERETA